MTSPTLFDHLLLLLLAVVLPVGGYVSMHRLRRRIDEGFRHTTRVTDYRNNMLIMWGVTAAAAALWIAFDRQFAGLGLAAMDAGPASLVLAVLLAAGLVGTNLYLYARVRRQASAAEELVRQTSRFEFMLPHTRRELRWFYGVSLTAGITEEVLYRGFMITYLVTFMPVAAAVVVSSLLFAIAHVYQGAGGVARALLVALVLAVIVVLTNSILLAALVHFLVDVISGRMIYFAYNRSAAATPREAC